ncbi:hypothetical protein FB451DRAFT_1180288 [Mycena latifolia]|nr:hypothetical protein FB451DRAFT_1180288 [Mycena latifolia]
MHPDVELPFAIANISHKEYQIFGLHLPAGPIRLGPLNHTTWFNRSSPLFVRSAPSSHRPPQTAAWLPPMGQGLIGGYSTTNSTFPRRLADTLYPSPELTDWVHSHDQARGAVRRGCGPLADAVKLIERSRGAHRRTRLVYVSRRKPVAVIKGSFAEVVDRKSVEVRIQSNVTKTSPFRRIDGFCPKFGQAMRERLPAAATGTNSSCCERRRSADPLTSGARPVCVCTHRYRWGAKERQLKTFPQERAWLRHNGVDKTCVRQAAAFPAATRHEAMGTRNFFERGIARSADSNPTRFMPPLLLHPKSP